jgi:hypothetical protein
MLPLRKLRIELADKLLGLLELPVRLTHPVFTVLQNFGNAIELEFRGEYGQPGVNMYGMYATTPPKSTRRG